MACRGSGLAILAQSCCDVPGDSMVSCKAPSVTATDLQTSDADTDGHESWREQQLCLPSFNILLVAVEHLHLWLPVRLLVSPPSPPSCSGLPSTTHVLVLSVKLELHIANTVLYCGVRQVKATMPVGCSAACRHHSASQRSPFSHVCVASASPEKD